MVTASAFAESAFLFKEGKVCHFAYAIHLAIAVPLLVIEVPFGKLSHVIYRPLAIYFQAVSDRAALARSEAPEQPVPQQARVA